MRLIDAGVENERLIDFIIQNDVEIQHAIDYKDREVLLDIFFDYFKGQTTAYDVDKVVEQLESESKKYDGYAKAESPMKPYHRGVSAAYRFSVRIVKEGGVSE